MNAISLPESSSMPAPLKSDLARLTGLRCRGVLNESSFDEAVQQFAETKLKSRGLILLTRKLADGHTRILVKEPPTGRICYLIDFGA